MWKFLQVTLAWAALVAWLVASGVSADLLQVFAYADHVAKGVAVTAKDHCGPCLAVDAARDASDHAAPVKHEVAKIKVKADGAVWSVRLPSAAPAASRQTSSASVSSGASGLATFVITETATTSIPNRRAASTSGVVDIPTASAPRRRSIRYSARVS